MVGKQHLSAGWQELEWGIRTKGRIFEKAYGEAFFERCSNDMAIEDTYSKGMSALDHTCKSLLRPTTTGLCDSCFSHANTCMCVGRQMMLPMMLNPAITYDCEEWSLCDILHQCMQLCTAGSWSGS